MAVKSKMWTVEKVDFLEQALELYLLCFLFFFFYLFFVLPFATDEMGARVYYDLYS